MTHSTPSRFDRNTEIRRGMLRSQLIRELAREDVQIATPSNYSGIDLLAYTLPVNADALIYAVPIQLAIMSYGAFLRDLAAWRTSGLLVVLLGDERESESVKTFALSAAELALVQMVGLIEEREHQPRQVSARAAALRQALAPYSMGSGGWRLRIGRWIDEKQSPQNARRPSSVAAG